MLDYPKTIEEAKRYRYGTWSGNPEGRSYIPARCAWEVLNGHLFYQCSRKNSHGPASLYCKQHARIIEED